MKKLFGSILFFTALSTGAANAATISANQGSASTGSYSGNFSSNNDRFEVNFTLTENSFARFETFGYAGGTLADGTLIADGGFDPTLTLFGSTISVTTSYFGDINEIRYSESSGNAWDDLIAVDDYVHPDEDAYNLHPVELTFLAPGNYTIVLTQFGNNYDNQFGWTESGDPDYVDRSWDPQGEFPRTNAYALQVNITPVTAVPVPAAMWLFGSGLFGLLWSEKRKQVI